MYKYLGLKVHLSFDWFTLIDLRKREREEDRERETSIACLVHMPQLGIKPETCACVLTRNKTCDLSVYKTTLKQLSHTNQGCHLSLSGSAKITIIVCLILWKELSQMWYNAKQWVEKYMGVHYGTLANFLML